MFLLAIIPLSLLLIYLLYPYLIKSRTSLKQSNNNSVEVNGVSVVLLLYNGVKFLSDKIESILSEISEIKKSELIIVDSGSTDGSQNVLQDYLLNPKVRIIQDKKIAGVSASLNMGIQFCGFEIIVVSDLRQNIEKGTLIEIIKPFSNPEIGAVSACLSDSDKNGNLSMLRKHENYIKKKQSSRGKLLGVYGPLYAFRKSLFNPIPVDTILDDLYISLNILVSHKIVMSNECLLYDDNINTIYDYSRAKRYLQGLFQILFVSRFQQGLSFYIKLMFLIHKILRVLIPIITFAVLVLIYIKSSENPDLHEILNVALLITSLSLIILIKFKRNLYHPVKVAFYYAIALIEVIISMIRIKIHKPNINLFAHTKKKEAH